MYIKTFSINEEKIILIDSLLESTYIMNSILEDTMIQHLSINEGMFSTVRKIYNIISKIISFFKNHVYKYFKVFMSYFRKANQIVRNLVNETIGMLKKMPVSEFIDDLKTMLTVNESINHNTNLYNLSDWGNDIKDSLNDSILSNIKELIFTLSKEISKSERDDDKIMALQNDIHNERERIVFLFKDMKRNANNLNTDSSAKLILQLRNYEKVRSRMDESKFRDGIINDINAYKSQLEYIFNNSDVSENSNIQNIIANNISIYTSLQMTRCDTYCNIIKSRDLAIKSLHSLLSNKLSA